MQDLPLNPELDLVLDRVVDVPVGPIWEAWTNAEKLMPWFCPVPWKVVACELDARPGGIFRTVMQGPEGEPMDNGAGCFLEVVHERRLVWTDALGPGFTLKEGAFMVAILDLEPLEGGRTRYRAVARHANAATAQQHKEMGFEAGWGAVLDQLVARIKAGQV